MEFRDDNGLSGNIFDIYLGVPGSNPGWDTGYVLLLCPLVEFPGYYLK